MLFSDILMPRLSPSVLHVDSNFPDGEKVSLDHLVRGNAAQIVRRVGDAPESFYLSSKIQAFGI